MPFEESLRRGNLAPIDAKLLKFMGNNRLVGNAEEIEDRFCRPES